MPNRKSYLVRRWCWLFASTMFASPALAQDAPPSEPAADTADAGTADIIVTAQKREDRLLDTPLAISAITGDSLAKRQISGAEGLLATLPNLSMGQNLGIARIAIRGLGLDSTVAGQEARVAYHSDGVYVSRPAATLGTFFDVNRVEVVRGPQGTLYGRNATAGAVNVITNDPKPVLGGYGRFTVGNYGTFVEEGALTGPVSDNISARIAFVKTDRNGFGRNLTTGQDIDDEHSFGVRAKVKIAPTSNLTVILAADYYTRNDNAFVYHFLTAGSPTVSPIGRALGGRVDSNPRNTYANVQQEDERHFAGVSATAVLDLGQVSITSITAYRDGHYRIYSDADDTDKQVAQIEASERGNHVSQELRLGGTAGRLNWIVGGFYFRERITGATRFSPVRSPVPPLGGAAVFGLNFEGSLKTDAYAAFGQIDYEMIDGLTLTGGLRYSSEDKGVDQRAAAEFARIFVIGQAPNFTAFQKENTRFSNTTTRLALRYKPSRNVSFYGSYSTGFKSGGYNFTGIAPAVRPEKLTAYEVGLKASALDGMLNLNLAAFYYDYTDLQVQIIRNATALLENAATARVKGIEGELTLRPVAGLELSGSAGYLDSKFMNYATTDPARTTLGVINLSGNTLAQAPRWTINSAIQYSFATGRGTVTARAEMQYSDLVYFTPFNRPELSQPGYTKGNLSLRYDDQAGWSIAAFVRNVSDVRTIAAANISGSFTGFPVMGAYAPPRTFGGTIGYKF